MQQRKIIDPFFQDRMKFPIMGRGGQKLAEVFVLDTGMFPVKESRRVKKRGRKRQ